MTINLQTVTVSKKAAHQTVIADGHHVGEVWREQVNVIVSKLTEPRRMAPKWRWFAKRVGKSVTLGRGTRAAVLLGPGFKSKRSAISALIDTPSSDTTVCQDER